MYQSVYQLFHLTAGINKCGSETLHKNKTHLHVPPPPPVEEEVERVRKDSAWRKRFLQELESDSGRDSARDIDTDTHQTKDNGRYGARRDTETDTHQTKGNGRYGARKDTETDTHQTKDNGRYGALRDIDTNTQQAKN